MLEMVYFCVKFFVLLRLKFLEKSKKTIIFKKIIVFLMLELFYSNDGDFLVVGSD